MAQKYVKLPSELPSPEEAVNVFISFMNTPQSLFCGLEPIQLFNTHHDIDRTWVVGSCVWFPAIYGRLDDKITDMDVAFSIPGMAEDFIINAKRLFENKISNEDLLIGAVFYDISSNVHGGSKLLRNNVGILDAWDIPEGVSIAEHLMGYRNNWERCAILAGACKGEPSALTRLVRYELWDQAQRRKQKENSPPLDYGS